MINVDTTIPMPAPAEQKKYPFATMEVGHSFFIEAADEEDMHRLRSAASHFGKRRGWKFTVRKATENEANGYRCWRTA